MIRSRSNARKAGLTLTAVGALAIAALQFSGCSKSDSADATEDSSTSGSVASGVGGASNGSSASGTMTRSEGILDRLFALASLADALASTACGTFSGSTSTVTYSDCSFGSSAAVWNGSVSFTVSGSSVTREVADGTTRTAASGSVVTINTTGSSLTPFNGDTAVSGGTMATFASGSLTNLAIDGVNFVAKGPAGATLFNHVLTTNSGNGGTPLTVSGGVLSGTVITYHQLAKVKATSVVSVGMSAGCCVPTSGTISTTFNTSATGALSKYNGATESLAFGGGCGTAIYTGPEGYSGTVTLAHCL